MDFLDKDTERILRQCVDTEDTYPEVLRNMFKNCSNQESVKLRSILHHLIHNGYISELSWADNVPSYSKFPKSTPHLSGFFVIH